MSRIMLIGFKASGKSTIGKALASRLNKPFYDTDELIADLFFEKKSVRKTPFEIYSEHGVEFFRELEQEVLKSLNIVSDAVIATGGGTCHSLENRQNCLAKQNSLVVYLKISLELVNDRLSHMKEHSFANRMGSIESEWEKRKSDYEEIADVTHNTEDGLESLIARIQSDGK